MRLDAVALTGGVAMHVGLAALGQQPTTVASDVLAPDVYGGDGEAACDRCEMSRRADWPLAPKHLIFEVLASAASPW